jgi:hypothetical protein
MITYVVINSGKKVRECFIADNKVNIENVTPVATLNEKTNKIIWLDETFKNKERSTPVIAININKKITIGDPKGIFCIGHLNK